MGARGTQPDSNESSFSVRLRNRRQIGGPWWFSCWPVLCPKVVLHPRKVNIYRATAISYIYVIIKAIRHRHSLITKPWASNFVQVAENSNVSTPVLEMKDAGGLSPPGGVVEDAYKIQENQYVGQLSLTSSNSSSRDTHQDGSHKPSPTILGSFAPATPGNLLPKQKRQGGFQKGHPQSLRKSPKSPVSVRSIGRIVLSDLRLPLVPLPSSRNLRTEDFNKE